jgi:hypothetical protein
MIKSPNHESPKLKMREKTNKQITKNEKNIWDAYNVDKKEWDWQNN